MSSSYQAQNWYTQKQSHKSWQLKNTSDKSRLSYHLSFKPYQPWVFGMDLPVLNDARFTNSPRYTPLTPSPWPSRRRSRLAKVSQEKANEATSIRMSWLMLEKRQVKYLKLKLIEPSKCRLENFFLWDFSKAHDTNVSVSKIKKKTNHLNSHLHLLLILRLQSQLYGRSLGSTNLHRRSVVSKSNSQSCAPMTHTCLRNMWETCCEQEVMLEIVSPWVWVSKPEPHQRKWIEKCAFLVLVVIFPSEIVWISFCHHLLMFHLFKWRPILQANSFCPAHAFQT